MSQTEDARGPDADSRGIPHAPATLVRCSGCRRALEDGEPSLVLMRDGRPVAAYHERCHPHHRRSGCLAC